MIHLCQEIFSSCVPGSIKDAVHLSAVSKEYQAVVNSEAFFNEWLCRKDPLHPFLGSKRKVELCTLKDRYFASLLALTHKMESFPMNYDRALANSDDVILLAGIKLISLTSGAEPITLHVPVDITVPSAFPQLKGVRSDNYLAINIKPDMPILIYSADGKTFLRRIDVAELLQFELVDHKLFVVDCFCNLLVYFLESENPCLKINLPGIMPRMFLSPLTFYKNFIVYQPNMFSNSDSYILHMAEWKWKKIEAGSLQSKPVPLGDKIFYINIDYQATQAIVQKEQSFVLSVCVEWCISENRLFFLTWEKDQILVSACDSVTGQLSRLHTIPINDKSLNLHCTASKLYCLFSDEMGAGKNLELLTMTFGKV